MPYATSGDAEIYYEVHGQGPAVLFVHGSGGHHMSWWRQVSYLSRDYTVVTLDLRGFGNSRYEGEKSAEGFVSDIEAVMDAAGADRYALVAQSIGAVYALKAVMRRPQRISACIMSQSVGGIDDEELNALVAADRGEVEKLPLLDRLLTPQFQVGRAAETFLLRQMSTFNRVNIADLRKLPSVGPKPEEVAASGVPIFFISGERDAALKQATVRRAHEKVPGSSLILISNGPHSLYWEMPEVFNNTLHGILQGVYGAG